MSIAGMILGIIAVLFAFILFIGAVGSWDSFAAFGTFISFPCIAVGLPLSCVGFYLNKKREQGIGIAVTGMTTNIVALFFFIIGMIVGVALSS